MVTKRIDITGVTRKFFENSMHRQNFENNTFY
jgi:hypothetical protein